MSLTDADKVWIENENARIIRRIEALVAAAPAARAPTGAPALSGETAKLPTLLPKYGRCSGMPIAGATTDDLNYYKNGAIRSLSDPSKEKFHKFDRAMIAAIDAEMKQPSGAANTVTGGRLNPDGTPAEEEETPF